ncbi:MAG: SpoIIE family protein phosphatase [Ignavibacteria bacterium]|nr:SpoIIE family protein phosphatase [Ignavibacteria bacterium]
MKQNEYNAAQRTLSALVDFSNLINSSLDINFILNNLLFTCLSKFHTSRGIITFVNPDGQLYVKSGKGIDDKILLKYPEVYEKNYANSKELILFNEKNKIAISREIKTSSRLLGVLFLGEKLTSQPYENEDLNFLNTICNIASTAIENSITFNTLKETNRILDSKVNQLSSLYDLSKELNGVIEIPEISKLLVYSVIGQLMVSKYALIIYTDDKMEIIESKFDNDLLSESLKEFSSKTFAEIITKPEIRKNYPLFYKLNIQLIVPMKTKGETNGIILLGKRFNSQDFTNSDIDFISSVGSLAIMAIQNAKMFLEMIEKQKIEKDLQLAKNIQKNLLPKNLPEFNRLNIAAYNETARQVGGDYYEAIKLSENKLLAAIADVSGKGVQAALMMANLQAFLKSLVKQNLPLNEASNRINDLVSENTFDGGFITFFWSVIDEKEMKMTYVNAGHNPPIIYRNGELIKLKKGGMLLGFMKTVVPYIEDTVEIQKGDLLVFFTDGITEAMDCNRNEYSDERLEGFIRTNYSLPAQEFLDKLILDVRNFSEGTEQSDDITCLAININ